MFQTYIWDDVPQKDEQRSEPVLCHISTDLGRYAGTSIVTEVESGHENRKIKKSTS